MTEPIIDEKGVLAGGDGVLRCAWAYGPQPYLEYHDQEWGRPVHGDAATFERLTLEAFQSGLSWLVILRKREAFRRAFAEFDPYRVARFGSADRARLLADAGIVRNGKKIAAAINNAQITVDLLETEGESALDELMWRYVPEPKPQPRTTADLAATDPASHALAKDLKKRGFKFLGPTTLYAGMQAMGVVNDHLVGCCRLDAESSV